MINALLPMRAATVQTLGHPAVGVIGWFDTTSNASGVAVTETTALTYSAVWCATRIISETIATLPCILYRRTSDDSRERATDDERYWLIHDEPHPLINPVTFFETLTAHMVLWGNCYARIVRDQRGNVNSFEPRLPDKMRVEVQGNDLRYYCSDPKEDRPSREILHACGLGNDGIQGYGVVRMAQQSIGGGMAADKQACRQFSNGALPGGLLVHPGRLDKEAREKLRADWNEVHSGADKAGKIGILHGGMDFKPISMSNEDAQFLESRQFSIREIARWFRLPPHMLADLADSSVRANIEQQAIEFIRYSLRPWICYWEQTLNRKLLDRAERKELYFEFLLEDLLRGDSVAQSVAWSTGRQWGWYSVNDIRRMMNMPPVENGDVYLQPSNMAPAGTVPGTISREFRANVARSLSAIVDEGKRLREDIEESKATVADSMERHGAALAEGLRDLRESRLEMRRDIAELGQTQVQGFTAERSGLAEAALTLFRAELACAVKIEKAEVAKAAKRQRDRGESFVGWLDSWYTAWRTELSERTRNTALCWMRITGTASSKWAGLWCDESRSMLLSASDGSQDGFTSRVQAALDHWDDRIQAMTP